MILTKFFKKHKSYTSRNTAGGNLPCFFIKNHYGFKEEGLKGGIKGGGIKGVFRHCGVDLLSSRNERRQRCSHSKGGMARHLSWQKVLLWQVYAHLPPSPWAAYHPHYVGANQSCRDTELLSATHQRTKPLYSCLIHEIVTSVC